MNLDNRPVEIIQSWKQEKDRRKLNRTSEICKKTLSVQHMCNESLKRRKGQKNDLLDNFTYLMKNIKLHIQKVSECD